MYNANLMSRDYLVLEGIYKYECLSWDHIYLLFFKHGENGKINSHEYMRKRLTYLCNNNFIELTVLKDKRKLYALKRRGVNEYRSHFDVSPEIVDKVTGKIVRNYHRACDLKKNFRLLPHQLELINFIIKAKNINPNYDHVMNKGFETKYRLMPDACLKTKHFELYLEQDMDTERKKKLENKFCQYRTFFLNQYQKRMAIFFIINSKNPAARAKLLVKVATIEMIDMFKGSFDAYIGTEEELIKVLEYFNNKRKLIFNQIKLVERINVYKLSKLALRNISDQFDFIVTKDKTVYCIDYFIANRMTCFNHAFFFLNVEVEFHEVYPESTIIYLVLYDDNLHHFESMLKYINELSNWKTYNFYVIHIDKLADFLTEKS